MNSLPIPMPDWTVLKANRMCMPVNQARNPTVMNRPIFTLFTGTPTARDLGAEQDPGGDEDEQDPPEQRDPDPDAADGEGGGEHLAAQLEAGDVGHVVGGHVAGDDLGHGQVEPPQH